ncbi:hypothetical protein [Subtercola vilae]|uniref:Uncharacterized protein n=1 Tax=Subtercola vilae TaxID=2056433 RepID=A0A4T2BQE5_9MICO|nr:hypothetical protein [Subtercola vilae]TIH33825.1 hypothetical protein D4765_13690 [Subtercola vilae]
MKWLETVTRMYREATAEAGPEGAERQDTFMVVSARIATEISAGRLTYELDTFIRSELMRVDESDGKKADAILRVAATGQGVFEITDELLDVVVTLGAGRRKAWRDVTASDLRDMDTVRYRNLRNAQLAYDVWRESYDAALPVLVRFGTFGAAAEGGGFPPKAAEHEQARAA